jgi:hypothetical protein
VAKRRKSQRTKKSSRTKKSEPVRRTDVLGAIRRVTGFRSFARYLASRSQMTLVAMARELGVNTAFFLNYHAKWHDETIGEPLLR